MRVDDFFREHDSPEVRRAAKHVDPPFYLAHNVYRLRGERRMTQEELARAADMRQPRIAEIERGDANPTLSTLAKLAAALGVSVSEITAEPNPDLSASAYQNAATARVPLPKAPGEVVHLVGRPAGAPHGGRE